MATLSNNDIARAIYLSTKGKAAHDQEIVLKSAVGLLSRRRLLSRSKAILASLNRISNKDRNVLEAKVWSKSKLDPGVKKDLIHLLKGRYGGKEIILEEKIDEEVIGGVKIEIENEMIDMTLKNKVDKLKKHLNKNYE